MARPKTIWVTGANGQLGSELRALASSHRHFNFLFTSREQLAIDDAQSVSRFLTDNVVDVCINTAAYTAVDLAETDREASMLINATAVGNLAHACKLNGARLLHVSTDYVFNGQGKTPYKESDKKDPVNYYGQTKLAGEQLALENDPECLIVRTSWVYSRFGKNFVKTMLRLMKEKASIGVVADQFGSPTCAADLATAVLHLSTADVSPGVYHFCNEGVISWFEFAVAIRDIAGLSCEINPIATIDYPTPAKRPAYSALDTSKFRSITGIEIPSWRKSLEICLGQIRREM